MQEKNSRLVLIIMKNLNFLVLCFVSIVISYSLSGIIAEGSALDFLSKVHSLALAPWKLLFIVISLYISLLFLMGLENLNNIQIGIRLVIEMVLVFLIIYCIGFTYTGIILLLLAVSIDFLPKSKWRIPFIILLCIVYLFFEYIIISLSSSIIPFSAYLEYFQNCILQLKITQNSNKIPIKF